MTFRDLYARYDEDVLLAARGYPARRSIISILWKRRWLVIGVFGACLLAGFAYITLTPRRYLASASILIDPRLGKVVGADPVQPGFIPDSGAIDSQVKLFTSQTVLTRVAKMANLGDAPEFNGSERSLLQRILHPSQSLDGGVDLKALEDAITIKRPERTYIVTLEVLSRDPQRSAEIANDLAQAYIEDQISARIDAARDDSRYVRDRLATLATQIKEAEDKVEAFKIKNNIVDTSGLRSNEQQVADLTRALGDARARTSSARARYSELKRLAASGSLDTSTEAVRSLTIERLRQQQAEATEQVAKLAATLGARHPELVEARQREAQVEKLIHDELNRLAASAAGDYQSAQANEAQISAEIDKVKAQSTQISRDLVPLAQLERTVTTLRASYDRYSQIRDNLGQQEANSPPGRVIAVARPPVSPSQPKKVLAALISTAAGLFLGVASALLVESLRNDPVPYGGFPGHAPPPSYYPALPRGPERLRVTRRYWEDDDATV